MDLPPALEINPPLINSSNPWATTFDDLKALYACPSIGAVTTRTSLLDGFDHTPEEHVFKFFDVKSLESSPTSDGIAQNASLNSLGYSPLPLSTYLDFIRKISDEQPKPSSKGFIISVTGIPEEIGDCYELIATAQQSVKFPLAMEVNLSVPTSQTSPRRRTPRTLLSHTLMRYKMPSTWQTTCLEYRSV